MALLKPLPRKFCNRDTITVVKGLLGKLLVKSTSSHPIVAKIVETEACKGMDDPASDAYVGKTERNQLMFGKLGIVYVYLVYRNYHCFNATCERESVPGAVLVRPAEVLEELRIALKNRKTGSIKNLSNGPGKLTQPLKDAEFGFRGKNPIVSWKKSTYWIISETLLNQKFFNDLH